MYLIFNFCYLLIPTLKAFEITHASILNDIFCQLVTESDKNYNSKMLIKGVIIHNNIIIFFIILFYFIKINISR